MRSLRFASSLARRAPSAHNAARAPSSKTAPRQRPISAAYYRGGTSRALMLQPRDLPRDRAKWPPLFRQLMGSGDVYGRQLDGMGAGISSLSKICLVEPCAAAPASADHDDTPHIDYTFVGLGIESDEVDVAGNCGNMSSAIGPYAYNAYLLPPALYAADAGDVTVRIRNTNTGKLINATFSVAGGQATAVGDYSIDGVSGKGSMVKLDFQHPYGSKTGKVLPTGRVVDLVAGHKVSCVDGANPAVFVRASDVGVDGTILPSDFNNLPDKLSLLERIRKAAAVAMGIAPTEDLVPRTVPKIGLVSMSSTHTVLSGQTLQTSQTDLVVRFISDTQPHRAIPLTAALTTAVAARIPGTIVEQLIAPDPVSDDAITIGHASGRLQVNATMQGSGNLTPSSATVYRTAKRLLEGNVFWVDHSESQSTARSSDTSSFRSGGTHSLGMAFVLESRGQDSRSLFENDAETEEQQEQDKQDNQVTEKRPPIRLFYRPEPPTKPSVPVFPEHPETPLTNALHQLHTHLTTLLSDPALTTKDHPETLTPALEDAYLSIVATKGKQWHDWAKKLARSKKTQRLKIATEAKQARKAAHGVKRTTKKEMGLDKWGTPVWRKRERSERGEKGKKSEKSEKSEKKGTR
jgi:2-methylaconitate cis-trans-isomerase PrpF